MTRETYDKAPPSRSFDKCIAGIGRLVERKLPLVLKTMALTWNQHDGLAMEATPRRGGLRLRFDGLLNPGWTGAPMRNGELQRPAASDRGPRPREPRAEAGVCARAGAAASSPCARR